MRQVTFYLGINPLGQSQGPALQAGFYSSPKRVDKGGCAFSHAGKAMLATVPRGEPSPELHPKGTNIIERMEQLEDVYQARAGTEYTKERQKVRCGPGRSTSAMVYWRSLSYESGSANAAPAPAYLFLSIHRYNAAHVVPGKLGA